MTFLSGVANDIDPLDPQVQFDAAESLGEGLRRVREAQGRSLPALVKETKVHIKHLSALEENRFGALPSRVFAIGYVRTYAQALGLDDYAVVERFKRESPDGTVPLQAPTGIAFEDVRRHSPRVIGALALVLLAVTGWNVFQRVSRARAPQPVTIQSVPETWATDDPAASGRPLTLGAPQPAPPDQTVPALYVTPGLEAQLLGLDPTDPEAVAAAAALATPAPPVQAAFNPRGAVYGVPANASQVTLQARRPSSLVVRVGERMLFARLLAEGEAYRAPVGIAATLDVSEPRDFDIYLNGEHGGQLEATATPLATLNTRAAALARQAAELEGRRQALLQAQAAARTPPQPAPPPTG